MEEETNQEDVSQLQDEFSDAVSFAKLPIEQIIEKLQSTNDQKVPKNILLERIKAIAENHPDDVYSVLKCINDHSISLDDFFQIISYYKNINLFQEAVQEYQSLIQDPQIDYEYMLKKKEEEIRELKARIGISSMETRNDFPEYFSTCIHEAIQNYSMDNVKYLIENGYNPNTVDRYGNAPIHTAILTAQQDIIEYLIQHGADIERKNKAGLTPLQLAVTEDFIDSTKLLLEKGARVNGSKIPLFEIAVQNGSIKMMAFLLDNGKVNINQRFSNGSTPLAYMIENSLPKIGEMLIDKGANIHQNAGSLSILQNAIEKNYTSLAIKCIKKGARLETKDSYDNTPLHVAIKLANYEICKALVEAGANIGARTKYGHTPLIQAAISYSSNRKKEYSLIVKLLLDNGADITQTNNKGKSAYFYAPTLCQ